MPSSGQCSMTEIHLEREEIKRVSYILHSADYLGKEAQPYYNQFLKQTRVILLNSF